MKRNALYATAGSALAMALLAYSLPASADVHVFASIQKTKDITVTENITITKTVDLFVEALDLNYASAAEADAIVNQENAHNTVDHTQTQLTSTAPAEDLVNYGIDLEATIRGSINGNSGIVDVNQDVGNMANQGNQVALAVATPQGGTADVPHEVVVNSQSEAEQKNQYNRVRELEDPATQGLEGGLVDGVNKSASIANSINGNTGIVNVNQNAGNNNNQANSEALAVAIDLAGVALSEAALGQVNGAFGQDTGGGNTVQEAGVVKTASMTGSLTGNVGVGGVNQAVGNNANQANVFSLSFIDGGGGVGLGR
ncbi:MAG: hypothetical protein R3D05_03985 [Dongiaceae bacterium]